MATRPSPVVNLPPGFVLEEPQQATPQGINLPPGFVLEAEQPFGTAAQRTIEKGPIARFFAPAIEAGKGIYQTVRRNVAPRQGEANLLSRVAGPGPGIVQDVATGLLKAHSEAGQEYLERAAAEPNALRNVERFLEAGVPVVGPLYRSLRKKAEAGDIAGALGETALTAIPAVGVPSKVKAFLAQPASNLSKRLYQSALKPSTTIKPAKLSQILETGLERQIPVSEKGLTNLYNLVDDLNSRIGDQVAANPNAPINKFAVTRRLGQTARTFEKQVTPQADLAAVSKTGSEFLKRQPAAIPASEAQALKVGTYRQLRGKSYGELKSATIEAQKSLARGLKEELEGLFPEIKNLNAQEARLLNLQPTLERAVGRIQNQQMMGIGTPITGILAGVATGSPKMGVGAFILKAILDDPNVKSRLAIAIHNTTKGARPFNLVERQILGYSAALADVVSASGETPNSRRD